MIPLVFLPGMMCDARLFASQIATFSQERAVQVAHIGGADTVSALAAQVLAHAPPRFALAGLSMGGIVAMEILSQAPDRVARIALMDTNPKAEADAILDARETQIAKVRAGGLAGVMRDEMKPRYLADGPQRDAILELCMDMALGLGPDVFENQSRALQTRPDQQDTLRNAQCPALILCGREDALCPLHRHTLMADLMPHATLQVIENAGHLPTLEQPQETTAALRRWLED
ncbi:Pimeloyl-ACP methyl ester carboxylesterase [Cognatiyoonia koreensis]|uniref:Pimeloyl-ACP methyl ester carboxylesterase n=1 Tax=Cognatiyoonia koreensis TaxID=364200 RepID=A0A1I0MRJ2_9RHOB|nr:alpha/beta fold hydrolase [Cognatiyoonia koreensis]SEV90444.1 Pimeloyl-ACP methyl ester carboxylesterase [Cognatiyoonia koreensis]